MRGQLDLNEPSGTYHVQNTEILYAIVCLVNCVWGATSEFGHYNLFTAGLNLPKISSCICR